MRYQTRLHNFDHIQTYKPERCQKTYFKFSNTCTSYFKFMTTSYIDLWHAITSYFFLICFMFFLSTPVLYLIGQKQCQTISDIIFVTHKYFPHFCLDKTKFSRFATYFFALHENISRL